MQEETSSRQTCAQASEEDLCFRWLGVGGIELRWKGKVLLIDPFLTRPSLLDVLFRPLRPNTELLRRILPRADALLVTHAHYDHLMDVPAIVHQTGAAAYGSENVIGLLRAAGVPEEKCNLIQNGDTFEVGPFAIRAIEGKHLFIPFFLPGQLPEVVAAPKRVWHYRMDRCFSFFIKTSPSFLVWHSVEVRGAVPAQVLVIDSEIPLRVFAELARLVRPQWVIPIHWDDFFFPLLSPIRPFFRPPERGAFRLRRLDIVEFAQKLQQLLPSGKVWIPQRLEELTFVDQSSDEAS